MILSLIIAAILCAVLVSVLYGLGRRKLLRNREAFSDDKLISVFGPIPGVDSTVVIEVIQYVAESYQIPRSMLRPNDSFSGSLSRIDSLRLDAGAEKLEKYLATRFGVIIPVQNPPKTIVELLGLVGATLLEKQ